MGREKIGIAGTFHASPDAVNIGISAIPGDQPSQKARGVIRLNAGAADQAVEMAGQLAYVLGRCKDEIHVAHIYGDALGAEDGIGNGKALTSIEEKQAVGWIETIE